MLGIALGHRVARIGRTGPDGRATVTVTDLAGTDGVADPATALTMLADDTAGEEVVFGLPASAGREAEARLRRAAEDAGLGVERIVPEPVAAAVHYGAISEGVRRTVLVVDQVAGAVALTVLDIAPDLTARIVSTYTGEPAGDRALAAVARVLAEALPDAVLLSGDLYATPAHRAEIEDLPEAQGLTVRCTDPELAVVHGLLLLEDFGLLRVATGPAPERTGFPAPLEDPEPGAWNPPTDDPEPRRPAAPVTEPEQGPEPERGAEQEQEQAPEPERAPEPEPGPEPESAFVPPPRTAPEPPPPPPPAASSPLPADTPLHSVPVTQLQAMRRDDHLLVLWAWPDSALTARVRWRREDATATADGPRDGDIRCQRRVYEHDGGLDLHVGRGALTLTVEALVPDPTVDTEGAASLRVPAEPPIVEYEPSVRRRLTGGRVASVTFTARTGCDLPALRIVHGLGRYRPTSTAGGTVVHEVPAQRLPAGAPLTVEFPLPGTRGPSWLVCFPAHGPASGRDRDHESDIDIRPTALHRLRVT
jgi:outer membrane biosynthesis protein TonB